MTIINGPDLDVIADPERTSETGEIPSVSSTTGDPQADVWHVGEEVRKCGDRPVMTLVALESADGHDERVVARPGLLVSGTGRSAPLGIKTNFPLGRPTVRA